jgi:hypothetical protein
VESITKTIHRMIELLEKSGQLWTHLLEDGILKDLQGREDKVHVVMVELKQQHKTLSLPEGINTTIEMKSL